MLAGINLDGYQPTTRDGWLLVLLAIRYACAGGTHLPPVVEERPAVKVPVGVSR